MSYRTDVLSWTGLSPIRGDLPHPHRRLQFVILGPFEARLDGERLDVGGPKQQSLLAALLLNAGQAVPVGELSETIWGTAQPSNPRRAVQLYVTRLRGLLDDAPSGGTICTLAGSYQINVQTDQLDYGRFRHGVREAVQAAERDDLDGEAAALAAALSNWTGTPLAGVQSDLLQREAVPRLTEQWLWATERRFDVEIRRGRPGELVSELVALSAQHPLRESLWALLITALYRCGRRAEALDAYHTVRRRVADELGVDLSERLQALYLEVLTGARTHGGLSRWVPVPRELPPGIAAFAGRADDLVRLDALLDGLPGRLNSPSVCAIAGAAGVGKTALVSHWARIVADRFPDGQFWVDLKGSHAGCAVKPERALARLLRALGVPGCDVPPDLEDQVSLYRSLMDGRRMLIVLDDASSPEQIRPLLPGAPGCLVLVTSRKVLSGLIAMEDAHPLALDPLTEADARQLLIRRLGIHRVRAEASAVAEIIELCAGLPLALAMAAARAAAHPQRCLDALAAELRAAAAGLDAEP